MRQITGRAELRADDGPLVVAVGVFDGLHLGHAWLLERLVEEARRRGARAAVITFDAHPDAVLLGQAPPLLMDPAERLERLEAAGIDVIVVEHFDDALRRTPYDVFVRGISDRCGLAAIVMTPDAAFGHERAGTPQAVAGLGGSDGFDVVVVPPFALQGREVRSSEIRAAISVGDLDAAAGLLGRPYAVRGVVGADGRVTFPMPVALPPAGEYPVALPDGSSRRATIDADGLMLDGGGPGPVRVEFSPTG